MLRKAFHFSEMDKGIDTLAIDVFSSVENTLNHLTEKPKLEEYLMAIKKLEERFNGGVSDNQVTNKSDELDVLLGVNSSTEIEVENPPVIRNKGCGSRKRLRNNATLCYLTNIKCKTPSHVHSRIFLRVIMIVSKDFTSYAKSLIKTTTDTVFDTRLQLLSIQCHIKSRKRYKACLS
ncbi:hypothetical protein L1887_01604 [Cichorium endivia]|nr:hypothetical protein L1887_01604 [Cichorium endivia]